MEIKKTNTAKNQLLLAMSNYNMYALWCRSEQSNRYTVHVKAWHVQSCTASNTGADNTDWSGHATFMIPQLLPWPWHALCLWSHSMLFCWWQSHVCVYCLLKASFSLVLGLTLCRVAHCVPRSNGDSGCICSVAPVCSGRGHLGLCESNQFRSHNRTIYRCLFLEKCSIINLCVNVFWVLVTLKAFNLQDS